jgi:hypothetical protein
MKSFKQILNEAKSTKQQFNIGDKVVVRSAIDTHNGKTGTVEKITKETAFNRIMFGDAFIYYVSVNGKTFAYGADEIAKL